MPRSFTGSRVRHASANANRPRLLQVNIDVPELRSGCDLERAGHLRGWGTRIVSRRVALIGAARLRAHFHVTRTESRANVIAACRQRIDTILAEVVGHLSVHGHPLPVPANKSLAHAVDHHVLHRVAIFIENPSGDHALRDQMEIRVLHFLRFREGDESARLIRALGAVRLRDETGVLGNHSIAAGFDAGDGVMTRRAGSCHNKRSQEKIRRHPIRRASAE